MDVNAIVQLNHKETSFTVKNIQIIIINLNNKSNV